MTKATLNQAIDRLRDEMASNSTHPGIQEVGAYMTGRLMDRPEDAGQVLAEGRTLKGAFEAIRSYASKHRTGDFAYVPPDPAFRLVAEYYGIDAQAVRPNPQALADLKPAAAPQDDLDLDALLGL